MAFPSPGCYFAFLCMALAAVRAIPTPTTGTAAAAAAGAPAGGAAKKKSFFVHRGDARIISRDVRMRAVPQTWYDGEIRRFVRLDTADPPPRGGVLFLGSSIFREWREMRDFEADFAPIPVLNRAFGGSETIDQLEVMEQIVFPHEPRVVVYYCGSNDLNVGVPPAQILDNFRKWCERARQRLGPDLRVVFVSVMKAPQKKPVWDLLDETNRLVAEYCHGGGGGGGGGGANTNTRFLDVNGAFFDEVTGQPRDELYRVDGLHLYPDAYDELLRMMRGTVEEVWGEATTTAAGTVGTTETGMGTDACDDPFLPPGMRR